MASAANGVEAEFPRHQAANETIRHAMVSGGVLVILEPWEEGCPLLCDFTSYNTLAQSHRARVVRGPGKVARYATHMCSLQSVSNRWGPGGMVRNSWSIKLVNASRRSQGNPDLHPVLSRDSHFMFNEATQLQFLVPSKPPGIGVRCFYSRKKH